MATAGIDSEGRRQTDPPWRWRGVGFATLAIALVGGIALRVVAPSPMWLDEALSVNIAQLGFSDMVEALRHDGHPALYYVLLGSWIDLFGDGDTSVRALSGVFSILTVPVLWTIGRRYEQPTALLAAVLALTSPYLLRYGTEARMYSLVALLVALGWLVTSDALVSPTPTRLAAVAATAAALVHTHYWALWVVAAALVAIVWTGRRSTDDRASLRVGAATAAGAATLVVWLGVLLDQAASTGTPWASRARPAEVVVETLQAFGGTRRFEGTLLGIALLILVIVGTTAVTHASDVLEIRFRPASATAVPAAMTVLALGIGTAAALVTGTAFEARYAAIVLPFVLVLAARGIAVLPGAPATVALVGVTGLALAVGVDEVRRDRTQGEEVAEAIDGLAAEGDIVVFCPDQVGPATTRTLGHNGARIAYPSGDGTTVDWADYLDRIAAVDPLAFAVEVDDEAKAADVWLVRGVGYRGFEGRCETIFDTLGLTRTPVDVVALREVFEPMQLTRFEPAP